MSPIAMRTVAVVEIPGVPPNWSQWRGTSLARDAVKRPWRDTTHLLAHSARNAAGWPLPVKTDPPTMRYLEVEIHKMTPLYDHDGAVSCLKPLIDGCQGAVIYKDSPVWCDLVTAPMDMQWAVPEERLEKVVLRFHLVDPRKPELADGH